jgi:class 3 adenylate cyclase/tetratricopeptide (TPR) repeat protein
VVARPDRRAWADEATVVFADISGFTKLSEKLADLGKAGAEELVAILNGTFEALLGVADAEGGDLLKFGGDALLLQFVGADHAARGCRAAYGMRAALAQRGPVVTGRGRVVLRISMGVHSGPFQLVLAGGRQRELFVVGEHASAVTEMESAADAGEILLSPATAALLPGGCLGAAKGPGVLLRKVPPGLARGGPDPVEVTGDLTALVPAAVRRRVEAGVHDPEHRHVGIGFVHMGKVDGFLREHGPDALADQLDHLVTVAEQSAADAGICLVASDVSTDGVKLLLTAGAPEGVEDVEGRMLDAARTILDADYDLPVRVGVNAGYGFAAEMGAPWRRTYTAMGDVTNLGARLMGKAAPGQLIASKAMVERSATLFERTALEPFMVKGKRDPQEAFAIGARIGRRPSSAATVAFSGRHDELASLEARLDGLGEGRGAVVEVLGEPGMGKSRLVAEALAGRPERVIRVTCDSFQSDRPYFVARLVLRAALGIPQALDAGPAGEVLQQRVLDAAPHLLPWVPLLAIAVDAEVEDTPEVAATDPSFRRTVLAEMANELVSVVLVDPVVFVFEDAMWMDEASALLFVRLLREIDRRPWLALVTTRGAATGLHAGLGLTVERMALEPLGADAVAAIGAAATEDDPLPEADLAVLYDRAGGNPLFLLELLATRAVAGSVDQLPSTLEDIVAARVDQLPPDEARLLRYAAVLGERFRPAVFDAALGHLVGRPAEAAFATLGEFVVTDAGDLRFTHGLVRQVAYEGLPYARRRELHRLVADVLLGDGELDEGRVSLLSFHYDRARAHDLAWQWSRRAGEQARAKYANVEAAAFFERALDNVRQVGGVATADVAVVAEAMGDAAEVAGRYEVATRGYRQARELRSGDDPYLPELFRKEGQLRERMARYPAAVAWYRRGMASARRLAEPDASRALGAIEGGYAAVRMRQNRYRECARWCRRAIAHAEAVGDLRSLAQGYTLLESALTELGDPGAAALRGTAVELFERLGDLIGLGNALSNVAIDAAMEGRWDESSSYFARAREVRIVAGDVVGVANVSHNLGELRSDQGRLAEAERLQREARRIWRAARYTMGVGAASSALGRTLARLGRHDESLELLDQARQSFVELGIPDWVDEAEARIVEAHVFAERYVEAVALADVVLGREQVALAPMLHRLRGIARGACIDPEAAAPELRESLDLAQKAGADYEAALALFELARLPVVPADERQAALAEANVTAGRLDVDLAAVSPHVPWLVSAAER